MNIPRRERRAMKRAFSKRQQALHNDLGELNHETMEVFIQNTLLNALQVHVEKRLKDEGKL